MPNPLKGETPLRLSDGREFMLVLDFAAMVEAETAYGKPLPQLGRDAVAGFAGATAAIFFGALRHFQPHMTLREATNLLGEEPEAINEALANAEQAAARKDDGSQVKEGKDSPNPLGTNSGASGAKSGSTRKPSGGQRRAPSN